MDHGDRIFHCRFISVRELGHRVAESERHSPGTDLVWEHLRSFTFIEFLIRG